MDHRVVSLEFLRSTNLIPVKVRPRQKDPFPEWDPRTVSHQDHAMILAELKHKTDLNLGALFAGKAIDIDVDGDSPYLGQALDYFLPKTPYVWGRASKKKSHRVYMLHEDFDRALFGPMLRYLKKLTAGEIDEKSYSVEVRGGKPENGLFSVLPGSVHPSGEHVEWNEELDPTVGGSFVEFPALLRGLRLAVSASIIAPYWSPGNRNDISLALSGVLWRIRSSTLGACNLSPDEEPPEGMFVLDYDDAEAIFKCLIELTGDKHGDERQRFLNLKNTWRKLEGESGAKVTGGKVLAELIGDPEVGERVVRALYRLLSDNEAAETIEKLAERYVMWYGPGVLIDLQMIQNNRSNPYMTKEQTLNSMGGKTVKIGDTRVPIAKLLFTSPIVHRVGGLTFDPSSTDLIVNVPYEGAMVNQWRGFATEPATQQISNEEIKPFYDYIRDIIANGNEDHAHWVFSWLADFIKFPDKKPGTALVLVGVEGTGKSLLGECILSKIIGPVHSGQTNSVNTLTHNFNTIIDNKIFIQCDEAVHSYQKDVASRLKSIITDANFIVESKGINAYIKPNHMRFLFTSNEEHAALFVAPSKYERRFTILKVSSAQAGKKKEYWIPFTEWIKISLPKIMRWLQDYRYDRVLIMHPIETEAKLELQRTSLDPEVQWILTRIVEGFPLSDRTHSYWFEAFRGSQLKDKDRTANIRLRDYWPDHIVLPMLEEDYRSFIRSLGKPVYSGSLMTTIKRVLPPGSIEMIKQMTVQYTDLRTDQVSRDRVRLYNFPTIPEIIDHLRDRYGDIIDDGLKDLTKELDMDPLKDERGEV